MVMMVMMMIVTYCNHVFPYWPPPPKCLLIKSGTMSCSCLHSLEQCSQLGAIKHCPPRESWQCHKTFWLSQLVGDVTDIKWDAAKCHSMHQIAIPQLIIIWAQISSVWRLRNTGLEQYWRARGAQKYLLNEKCMNGWMSEWIDEYGG